MAKIKTYTIRQDELEALIDRAAEAGVQAYKKAESKARDKNVNRNLHNTKKLLESYRSLKNDLQHSDYEAPEAQLELRFKCVEDLMNPGETSTDNLMAKEIERLQENAWRKRQIERALDLLKEDCESRKLKEPEAMRKYRIIMALYIQDDPVDVLTLADMEAVTERTVYRDVSDACKMLTPYLFSIEAITNVP